MCTAHVLAAQRVSRRCTNALYDRCHTGCICVHRPGTDCSIGQHIARQLCYLQELTLELPDAVFEELRTARQAGAA
jgi:hypothetical protein